MKGGLTGLAGGGVAERSTTVNSTGLSSSDGVGPKALLNDASDSATITCTKSEAMTAYQTRRRSRFAFIPSTEMEHRAFPPGIHLQPTFRFRGVVLRA